MRADGALELPRRPAGDGFGGRVKRASALLLPALLALVPAEVAAQSLYKCTAADGRVTYQETPCVGEHAQKRLDGGNA
ncbi:MAG: DUF4124 domain-containing protein, partial [Burkholderiales bacterium]|nr:DUF4124 domain-containing protein [Burkholderiales bacterium]